MPKVRVINPLDTDNDILRVAAYCRVSSDSEDQLNSYAAQISYWTDHVENTDGWELVDVYADEGISGTQTERREEFQNLMRDARRGKIDVILCKSISRFSRNTADCLLALRELKEMGVTVRLDKENIERARTASRRSCLTRPRRSCGYTPATLPVTASAGSRRNWKPRGSQRRAA